MNITLTKEDRPTVEVRRSGEYGEEYSFYVNKKLLMTVDAQTPEAMLMSHFTQALVMGGYRPQEKEFSIHI